MKSTGKREVKKKKAAKIYCLDVILLLMDINMKNDSERGIGGREWVGLTGQLNGNKVASVCPRGVINKPGILECPRSSLGPWSNKWRAHTQTYMYIYIYIYVCV